MARSGPEVADIFRHYGLSMEGLAGAATEVLKQAEVSA